MLGDLSRILIAPTSSSHLMSKMILKADYARLQSSRFGFSLLCVDARLGGAKSINCMLIHHTVGLQADST